MAERPLFHGTVRAFYRLHDLPAPELSPIASDDELIRAGVLKPGAGVFADGVILATAYACAEWHRQVLDPDEWADYLSRVPVAGKAVLDVGCGAGATAKNLLSRGAACVVGADANLNSVETAASIINASEALFVQADGHALPFPDDVFDVVICRIALNYMNVAQAVSELCRVTRPGGRICVVVHRVWYYLSMLQSGRKSRADYGRRVILNTARRIARGRQRGSGETFITARQLRREFSVHSFFVENLWTPTPRSSYLGAVFEHSRSR